MESKIRRKWDLLTEYNCTLLLFSFLFLLGGLVGSIFSAFPSGEGGERLKEYLTDYLFLAEQGALYISLFPVVWWHLKYLVIAVVFSYSALGIIGLPLLIGVKGFFFSFSVGCLYRVFGINGLLPAFSLFGLSALAWGPAVFLVGMSGFINAKFCFDRAFGRPIRSNGISRTSLWQRLGLGIGLALCGALLECWLSPVLLRAAAYIVLK